MYKSGSVVPVEGGYTYTLVAPEGGLRRKKYAQEHGAPYKTPMDAKSAMRTEVEKLNARVSTFLRHLDSEKGLERL